MRDTIQPPVAFYCQAQRQCTLGGNNYKGMTGQKFLKLIVLNLDSIAIRVSFLLEKIIHHWKRKFLLSPDCRVYFPVKFVGFMLSCVVCLAAFIETQMYVKVL